MSKIFKHIKSEINHLPFIIGKVIGGFMAAVGFPGAIAVSARQHVPQKQVLLFCFVGILGILIFILCSKLLNRMPENNGITLTSAEKTLESKIAWIILLVLAAVFMVIIYLTTT